MALGAGALWVTSYGGPEVPVGRPLPRGTYTEPSVMAAGPTGLWVLGFPRNRLFHLAMRRPDPDQAALVKCR